MNVTYDIRFIVFRSVDNPQQVVMTTVTDTFIGGEHEQQMRQALPINDPVKLILALRDAANELEKLV